ncbi:unnamed protein product [Dovyalis caffra]|uniref:Uncharacterized protein n=1 Tax=Dovyalis caffra TaxID=77055 RepID=A0AAV1S664_9ROSI|nr:unnamed protein product [Dovyalis caffra]
MDMRQRTKSHLLDGAIGNIVRCATVFADPEMNMELHELAKILTEGIAKVNDDYSKSLQGDEGFQGISKGLDQLEEMLNMKTLDRLSITTGFPVWLVAFGKAGSAFMNFIELIETVGSKEIEAWMTFDEKNNGSIGE